MRMHLYWAGIVLNVVVAGADQFFNIAGSTRFKACDDCAEYLHLNDTYLYFGHSTKQNSQDGLIYLNSNGLVKLDGIGYQQYAYDSRLNNAGSLMIAPYWSDIDTRSGGEITYKETQEQVSLNKAKRLIKHNFRNCGGAQFTPTSLFMVTYDNVGPWCNTQAMKQGKGKTRPQKHERHKNSFQMVLVTNGNDTYTIITFKKIEWDFCWNSNKMVFSKGGTHRGTQGYRSRRYTPVYFNPESDLVNKTNAREAGQWMYKISESKLRQPGCDIVGTYT